MFIDTHAHVNFNVFRNDADETIRRALEEDTWMVLVGSDYKTSKRALDYANKYENGVYAGVGVHPVHLEEVEISEEGQTFTTRGEEYSYEAYEKLAKFEKTVAIGEIGLDYYHIGAHSDTAKVKQRQQEIFIEQLGLARALDLPAIIHCRQAHDDMVMLLEKFRQENRELIPKNKPWAVMHCFSGDEDLAWKYFSLGIIISFTGLVTFSGQWDDLIRKLPLDKFMVETDSPYMTPEPHRGKRNEPVLVKFVAARIAEIKGIDINKVAEVTTNTARMFFNV